MTKTATKPSIEVVADAEALAQRAADWLLSLALAKKEDRFAVSLSGGSTPKRLYQLLAAGERRAAFPWARTHFFWGDERFVPHDHPDSNYRMVREAMLSHVPIPPANIHPMPTEGLDAAGAVTAYERTLKEFYGAETLAPDKPLFDVVLLGLGTNGHTASLFPDMPVLKDRTHWVGQMTDPKAGTRLTLTYPALESCRDAAFLVAGPDKRPVVAEILGGASTLPAAELKPLGTLHFLLDRAAAPDGVS